MKSPTILVSKDGSFFTYEGIKHLINNHFLVTINNDYFFSEAKNRATLKCKEIDHLQIPVLFSIRCFQESSISLC